MQTGNIHPVKALYGRNYDFPLSLTRNPKTTYAVAAIPRSGSTFLCLKLWETGALGAPMEYLNLSNHTDLVHELGGGDLFRYWRRLQQLRTSPNGVFGFKIFPRNYHDVAEFSPEALAIIEANKVIRLRRRDIIQQAISYSRAILSELWFAEGNEKEVDYSFDHILECVQSIKTQDLSWDRILTSTSATVHDVYYEDVKSEADSVIEGIANFLEVDLQSAPTVEVYKIRVQRDETSANWVCRFREEAHARKIDLTGPLMNST